jgi:hypothetical protein
MKKFILKLVVKWFLPSIKDELLKYIESIELQKKYVKILNEKIDIPGITEETEEKLIDAAYDAARELAKENINKIDINLLLDRI